VVDALPIAELIWRKLEDMTQQEVAGELGWSREGVRNYAALRKICSQRWHVVGTTFGAVVPFSERLLRDIIPLRPQQQMHLVRSLAAGSINKARFKRFAVQAAPRQRGGS
jgi:hypothetical protein